MYIALRGLYQQYYSKQIGRGQAVQDKKELMCNYENELIEDKTISEIAKLWIRISVPARNYEQCPTIENADAFYAAVYNLPKDWKNKRTKK